MRQPRGCGGSRVIAADIPSGLSGDTGWARRLCGQSARLSSRVLKKGHVLNAAKDHCGAIRNENIGIPLLGEADWLAERADLAGVIGAAAPPLPQGHVWHGRSAGRLFAVRRRGQAGQPQPVRAARLARAFPACACQGA